MKCKHIAIVMILVCLVSGVSVSGVKDSKQIKAEAVKSQSGLELLPRLCDFEMRRITSADAPGRNRDWRVLEPGQTLVLAEIQGPGCIVHFRDNVTSREKHHLQMNILRM